MAGTINLQAQAPGPSLPMVPVFFQIIEACIANLLINGREGDARWRRPGG